ncbi:class I SAM-dependent methyltransferase [Nocardioides sp. cx-173]|uniref:class I SAM-dependent methyltransferase n=1 Tax=Nocardioides sp. cx-173 TaxID=2898796 RepID=UPI001E649D44|nr:class I SAM-dependent methyltransferase [Nocardioides sp. cx-173]MCD4523320.1 class I SAM-dependent methyltransferase [Nocardioides sp. cx-173]UGB42340.1 class I SAM-dependent methyltransferase [Nocardioides sp. cx-173]
MRRHDLLRALHEVLQPRTYLEIGVNNGRSLTLSRTRSIGIDPFFTVVSELLCDLHLVRTTSDEFFAREHPLAHFEEPLIDLAFIDGMHLSEYALRDLINVERFCHPGSVVVLDDMLPRNVGQARRVRESQSGGGWTGDVYKVAEVLRTHRPDLVCLEVDTQPTGTAVVLGLDAGSRVLLEAYDDLLEVFVVPDPQPVPDEVLGRTRAHDAADLLARPLWADLVAARADDAAGARERVTAALADLRPVGA